MTISQSTIKKLWGSSQKCTICQIDLITYSSDGTPSVLGEMAHIHGENPQSMRYDATLPDDFVNSAANLILLCPNCHTLIDKKENENDYSPENLYEYKDQDIVHTYLPEFLSDVNHVLNWADMNNITTENKHLFDQQINFVLNKYTKKLRDMGIAENIIDGFLRECNNILCDAEFHHDLF